MRITAKHKFKHHPYYMEAGDSVTVPDEIGQQMVDLGWCVNADTGESVQAPPGETTLDIHNSKLSTTSTEI